jgi:plastocyanin
MKYLSLVLVAATVIVSGCASTTDTAPNDSSSGMQPSNVSENATVVTHTNSGFEPGTVTIEQGETVVWMSETGNMWVASDQHPTHTEYSGTSRMEHCQNGDQNTAAFDQCRAGERFSFTFEQTGEWGYHNHENNFQSGTVIVE